MLVGGAGAGFLSGGAGTGTAFASSDTGRYTYKLTANVENLTATSNDVFRLWDTELDNRLTGNQAFNELDGFAGRDTLTGGLGIDQFTLAPSHPPNSTQSPISFT
jgi:Ca2+-binding RTX toxin-like protein